MTKWPASNLPRFSASGQSIYLGDCSVLIEELPAGSVDVIVTSPPYNIGTSYSSYDDTIEREEYLMWMGDIARGMSRVLHPEGSIFINLSGSCLDPWVPMDVAMELRRHFVLQNRIIWAKSVSISDESHGHFRPINSPRFLNQTFEDVFHFTHEGTVRLDRLSIGVPYAHKSNVTRWSGGVDRRCGGRVWFIPYDTINDREDQRGGHVATFPVELPTRCIKLHGLRDDLMVLDPFLGHGTTLVATRDLGLQAAGCEIDEGYVAFTLKRLEEKPERPAGG